jgi:hypothetical protein
MQLNVFLEKISAAVKHSGLDPEKIEVKVDFDLEVELVTCIDLNVDGTSGELIVRSDDLG